MAGGPVRRDAHSFAGELLRAARSTPACSVKLNSLNRRTPLSRLSCDSVGRRLTRVSRRLAPHAGEGSLDFGRGAAYALAYAILGELSMTNERRVRIFRNGRNQAVRIPREFELPGDEAIMRREGGRLIIEPATPGSLIALLATLEPIEEDLDAPPDQPPEPVDF